MLTEMMENDDLRTLLMLEKYLNAMIIKKSDLKKKWTEYLIKVQDRIKLIRNKLVKKKN